jgi:hypothetical protein
MNEEIVVIDDIIPKKYQEILYHQTISQNFPYYFYPATTIPKSQDNDKLSLSHDKNDIGTFTHRFVCDGVNNSEHTEKILEPFVTFKDRLDSGLRGTSYAYKIDYNKITRLQGSIVAERKRGFGKVRTPWHVDMSDDHIVMLYYIVDADGRTLFENGDSVTPKQGRCVVFNGKLKHCIELSNTYRATLNFNILY